MDTEDFLQILEEQNPDVDKWFIPIDECDPFELFIRVGKRYYRWNELSGLEVLTFKPATVSI